MIFTSPEKLLIGQRRARVVALRVEGKSLESIAETIRQEFELPHYCRQRSHDDLLAALSKSNRLTATEVSAYRRIEELRLDYMWSKLLTGMAQGDEKSITAGVRVCRAKSQLMGLDAGTESIVENSVKQELNSVLDQLQASFDAETYSRILTLIAGMSDPIEQDD